MNRTELREFVTAYLEAALWSSTAHGVPEDTNDGSFDVSMESYGLSIEDIAPVAKIRAMRDCIDFVDSNDRRLRRVGSPAQHGHDFWLTRNRHGAGFWDRGYPQPLADHLTQAAHAYGGCDLYVDDEGLVYGF